MPNIKIKGTNLQIAFFKKSSGSISTAICFSVHRGDSDENLPTHLRLK